MVLAPASKRFVTPDWPISTSFKSILRNFASIYNDINHCKRLFLALFPKSPKFILERVFSSFNDP